jgi:hypothetical protein
MEAIAPSWLPFCRRALDRDRGPGQKLALAGSHRFSDYTLTFRFDDLNDEETRLRAETKAAFPGFKGSVYRALVIGTRGHVLITNRILSAVKRRAERV